MRERLAEQRRAALGGHAPRPARGLRHTASCRPHLSGLAAPLHLVCVALARRDLRPCRRIGIIDRRWGPSSLGLSEGVKESVVKVGIVHGNYPASDLATAARSYVLL